MINIFLNWLFNYFDCKFKLLGIIPLTIKIALFDFGGMISPRYCFTNSDLMCPLTLL